jgi:hypothetical protein
MTKKLFVCAVVVALALGVSGCKRPWKRAEPVDTRPQIAVANASAKAVLVIDGITIGPANAFDGKEATVRVSKGTHVIEILESGRLIYTETVTLADDITRTITIR